MLLTGYKPPSELIFNDALGNPELVGYRLLALAEKLSPNDDFSAPGR